MMCHSIFYRIMVCHSTIFIDKRFGQTQGEKGRKVCCILWRFGLGEKIP